MKKNPSCFRPKHLQLASWRVLHPLAFVLFGFQGGFYDPIATAQEISLPDLYKQALSSAETVEIQKTRVTQAQERLNQTATGLWPKVGLGASYIRQDSSSSSTSSADQLNAKVMLTQPLYHGAKETAAADAAKADVASQVAIEEQSRQTLYTTVVQAYFATLIAETDLNNLSADLELAAKRTKEMRERTRIGRSRNGELLSAMSQEILVQSNISAAQAHLDQAWDVLAFVTGSKTKGKLAAPLGKIDPTNLKLEDFLKDLEHRADIVALQKQLDYTNETVALARSEKMPAVDLLANYYIVRPKPNENVKWDAGIALTYPLYEGGIVNAQVRENLAKVEEKRLLLEQAKRIARKDIEENYKLLKAQLEQLLILDKALAITEKNYKEQSRDYQNGLVTDLDVLQALTSYEDSKRGLDRLKIQAQQSLVLLNASTGKIP